MSFLEIEQTGCLGPCPTYIAHFSQDSTWYHGLANVTMEGKYRSTISVDEWSELERFIDQSESWEERYKSTHNLDLPTTYLRVSYDGVVKEISIYGSPPKAIKPCLDQLSNLIDTLNWEKER